MLWFVDGSALEVCYIDKPPMYTATALSHYDYLLNSFICICPYENSTYVCWGYTIWANFNCMFEVQ